MSGSLGWISGILGYIRCKGCNAVYLRINVNVNAMASPGYWFLRGICHICGTGGVGTVIMREAELGLPSGSRAEEVLVSARCASCRTTYLREDLHLVANWDEYWYVRCNCHNCQTKSVGVVVVRPNDHDQAVLSDDDLLDAHDLLRDYVGDVTGLFAPKEEK